ncbi:MULTISPECIES: S8 family peptidase [unclassified Psychrobacter]|uniref:S8 family peptidase n=1 Tax=unclassified Psychrobacter TaxID=196806 RepID=UPI000C343404|nr:MULTISPECIES: S8 family peptidase [unclassified Psychrobacter]MBA6243790.1 S8 family peptidase [Psychrobacter sp. Urea-trap-18]MBA6285373.1 S8 family peptidase [Psychrobacter sp. Urea-trap-16]MBA6319107.1 S8 family peptidase [Psychrobacter sp. Urea-trap-20]MBA6335126.1 S8 family peptidase [Psychrobacter sp. Urea-trap-19]PKG59504.1 hypothetical protein CXF63_11195 [Psychrobacter sp. Choline-3u-12]
MNDFKNHLSYNIIETYKYHAQGSPVGNQELNVKPQREHGRYLLSQLAHAYDQISEINNNSIDSNDVSKPHPITNLDGVFLTVESDINTEIDTNSFDNTIFKLRTLKSEDNKQVLTFFLDSNNQEAFEKRIKNFTNKLTATGKPRNQKMLNNISIIRNTNLEDLWKGESNSLPTNLHEKINCEIWFEITKNSLLKEDWNLNDCNILASSEDLDISISSSFITLPNLKIYKVKANRIELKKILNLYSDVVEIRPSSESPSVFVDMGLRDQLDFTNDLNDRIIIQNSETPIFVSILDTGVNYNNKLLKEVCKSSYCVTWNSGWAPYTDNYDYSLTHGSRQAGIAAFGAALTQNLIDTGEVVLTHEIESGRILPAVGRNEEELYGAITLATIEKLRTAQPNAKRIYSMAVTSSYKDDGLPTSWSAAIDNFCMRNNEDKTNLFLISAGNAQNAQKDYWKNAEDTKIQDPAQAWNAVTVGSCTNLYNVSNLLNPEICSRIGDINPTTSSSINWEWKDAPFKPEIICEGGNRLIDQYGSINSHDDLSMLTASGKTQGAVIGLHTDTSAATAEASYIAAKIMRAYPDKRPETIRGLLVHSAEWSDAIKEKLESIANRNIRQKDKIKVLRICGYGNPDLTRAMESQNNRLTLIIESSIKPFDHKKHFPLNNFNIHSLPWPKKVLRELPLGTQVKLTITLSYFIEPNPRIHTIKSKYVYRSHGLSFALIKPGQRKKDFIQSISRRDKREDDYEESDYEHRWYFGKQLQNTGSIHKDIWEGNAEDLIDMSEVAIIPVTGWWKLNKDKNKCLENVNYSLIVSLEVEDNEVDIYTEVATKIADLNQLAHALPVEVSVK